VVKGIEEQAERNGYRILLCNSGADIARSRSSLQLLSGKMVDGIITMDAFSKLPELSQLIGKAPWVQCAEHDDNGQISCVGIDDDVAAQSVVHYLAGQGRQRIALINHDLRYRYARLRQQGYAYQLKEQQLAWQAIAYASELSFSAGKAAMNQLLAGETRPDAVFAVSDTLAAGAMAAIQQAGLRIPQDIAVVGFDGSELADMVSPPLTTLAQPSREIGRRACELVLQKIIRPDSPPQCVIMQGELVVRASS
jgi:DNA-binding LacI/PurR family transcriptional regulator